MHLKEAKEKNKLEYFIKKRERTHPKASHHHFRYLLF
jgi:putative IMPACT (imprinted ancient) family translation regulator